MELEPTKSRVKAYLLRWDTTECRSRLIGSLEFDPQSRVLIVNDGPLSGVWLHDGLLHDDHISRWYRHEAVYANGDKVRVRGKEVR